MKLLKKKILKKFWKEISENVLVCGTNRYSMCRLTLEVSNDKNKQEHNPAVTLNIPLIITYI